MHFICPIPNVWNRVYSALCQAFKENDQITEKPPVALILGGWHATSDERKQERWIETVKWAENYDYLHLIPDLKENEQYWVHEMSRGYVDGGMSYTIFEAAEYEDESHLLECIEAGKVNDTDEDGQSALMIAAFEHWEEGVRLLLDNGADIERDGASALQAGLNSSVDDDWLPIVRLLIDRGVSIHVEGKDGWTPLTIAAFDGSVEKLQFILALNPELNQRGGGMTALMHAASVGSVECCCMLLEAGADATISNSGSWDDESKTTYTAIDIAKGNDHKKIVKLIEEWRSV